MESVYKRREASSKHHSINEYSKKEVLFTINMKCIAAILLLALATVALAETKAVEIESVQGAKPVVSGPEAENAVASGRSKRGYVLSAYTAPVAYSAYTAPVAYSAYSYPYAYSAYSAYPYYASAYSSPYYYV